MTLLSNWMDLIDYECLDLSGDEEEEGLCDEVVLPQTNKDWVYVGHSPTRF